ncbi:hypothetical protein MRS66_18235 [Vibrio cholerae]|nr:hypothetical protein [Vibrio cholerae]
MKWQCVWRCKF